MPRVYVSIGSNLEPAVNVRRCVDTLAAEFAPLTRSPVYVSAAVGFAGDDFHQTRCILVSLPAEAQDHLGGECAITVGKSGDDAAGELIHVAAPGHGAGAVSGAALVPGG